jgi:hypothetical protein
LPISHSFGIARNTRKQTRNNPSPAHQRKVPPSAVSLHRSPNSEQTTNTTS